MCNPKAILIPAESCILGNHWFKYGSTIILWQFLIYQDGYLSKLNEKILVILLSTGWPFF